MSFTRVQSTGNGTTAGGTLNRSFSVTPTAGNFIAVHIAGFGGSSWSVTDNQGNTYHEAVGAIFSGFSSSIWYAWNIAASGTFTVTISGVTRISASAVEWSGFDASTPVVKTASNTIPIATVIDTGTTGTTTETNAVVCTAYACNGVSNVITVDTVVPAWTTEWQFFGLPKSGATSRVVTSVGTQQCGWTTNAAAGSSAVIAAFSVATVYTPPRFTQELQSIATTTVPVVRGTQITQALSAQTVPIIRLTQVIQTVLVLNPEPPPEPITIIIPKLRWGLERFDIKTRQEDTS